MSATTVSYASSAVSARQRDARRARPHGLDRLVMRVSLMMLLAARRHAESTAVSYDEHTRRREAEQAVQRRDLGAARLTARTF